MKKKYESPVVKIEVYELNANIASNCALVTKPGPGIDGHTECEGYVGPWMQGTMVLSEYNVNFYEDSQNCDCYTTGGGTGVWTS